MEIGGFSLVGVGVYKGTSSDFGTSGHIIMLHLCEDQGRSNKILCE